MTPTPQSSNPATPAALARAFRAVMRAFAAPGEIVETPSLTADPGALPGALPGAAWTFLRALSDREAPVWLSPTLAEDDALDGALRFALGAAPARSPAAAAFLVGPWSEVSPALETAARGSAERPDASATALINVNDIATTPPTGPAWIGAALKGPGVPPDADRRLWLKGPSAALWRFCGENRKRFPQGVDLAFCAGRRLTALPRSITVEAL